MKPFVINAFLLIAIGLPIFAKNDAIREFPLDEQTVYSVLVSTGRVTTISFPGPIAAIDAAQVSSDLKRTAAFQIAHTKGSSFFSVRGVVPKAKSNVNVRWRNKTYVLELSENNDSPFLSVNFRAPPEPISPPALIQVTPARLLALLDKAKSYRVLKTFHPETLAQVEYRNFEKEPRIIDYKEYAIRIDEVLRFNPEDTLVFRVALTNKTDVPLVFAPNGFSLRVGERTYPQSISDAGGLIPPKAEVPAYFAITGTPNGGRSEISIKNDFYVVLDAKPGDPKEVQ